MKIHTPRELAGGMAEIEKQTDRGAAIIAASLLEHDLAIAIQHRLLPTSRTIRDNLFGSRGTLGSFQDKIDIGFALGLYNKHGHHDLEVMRKIRNRFAHAPIALAFQESEINKLCSILLLGAESSLSAEQKEPTESLHNFMAYSVVPSPLPALQADTSCSSFGFFSELRARHFDRNLRNAADQTARQIALNRLSASMHYRFSNACRNNPSTSKLLD